MLVYLSDACLLVGCLSTCRMLVYLSDVSMTRPHSHLAASPPSRILTRLTSLTPNPYPIVSREIAKSKNTSSRDNREWAVVAHVRAAASWLPFL